MSDNVSQEYDYYAMQTGPPFYGSFSMRIAALYRSTRLEIYLAYQQLALDSFVDSSPPPYPLFPFHFEILGFMILHV